MHKLRTILLAAAATAGLATTAVAFPLNDISVQAQGVSPVQNARVYCGGGRCVLTRRHARRWYRSHGYAYGPRGYGAYGYAPRAYGYYWR